MKKQVILQEEIDAYVDKGDMTYYAFGKRFGIPTVYMYRLRNGKAHLVPVKSKLMIAKILGLDADIQLIDSEYGRRLEVIVSRSDGGVNGER